MKLGSIPTKDFFCARCPYKDRKEVYEVPNFGNTEAQVLIIGEAPGNQETIDGKPFCLEESSLILTADLLWKPLGEVNVGDKLLTCDENGPLGCGASGAIGRKWRFSEVTNVFKRSAPCYRIVTPFAILYATSDHLLLTDPIGKGSRRWLRTDQLQYVGRNRSKHYIRKSQRRSALSFVFNPWPFPATYNLGWSAGFYDGEGHISWSKFSARVGISQNEGPTLDYCLRLLQQGHFNVGLDGIQGKTKRYYINGGTRSTVEFIGRVQPKRLLPKLLKQLEGHLIRTHPAPVETVEYVGTRDVVDIKTTTHTFIANGLIVHNCGSAGRLLNAVLQETGWDRLRDLYIANVVLCQPPEIGGRVTPSTDAINCCKWKLYYTIAALQPKLLIAMGNTAIEALFDVVGITEFRSTLHWWEPSEVIQKVFPTIPKKIKTVATFHPAAILRQWEFLSTVKRDFRKAKKELLNPEVIDVEPPITYYVCQTMDHIRYLCQQLSIQKSFVFDCETTDLSWQKGKVLCWSFCYDGTGWVIPFNSIHQDLWADEERAEILQLLKPMFENVSIEKVGQNIPFDWQFLLNHGIDLKGPLFDTMQAQHLVDENVPKGLDDLAEAYTNWGSYSNTVKQYLPNKEASYAIIPDEALWHYAAKDAVVTWTVRPILEKKLQEEQLTKVFYSLAIPLLGLLTRSVRHGIYIARDKVGELAEQLKKQIAELEKVMFAQVGYAFNPKSPKDLQQVFFQTLKLTPTKKTKTGYSTDESVLEELANVHEVPKMMLKVRELNKQIGTYLTGTASGKKQTGMARYIDANNRIHTEFLPTGTVTGRLSSRGPNLENVSRDSIIRSLFIAPPKKKLIIADYSAAELWTMAFLARDQNLLHDLRTGDPHTATAHYVYGIPEDQPVPKETRVRAKGVNFGVSFGRGVFSLAQKEGLSTHEAEQLLRAWFGRYNYVQIWINSCHYNATQYGFVQTLTGRRRHLYGLKFAEGFIKGEIQRQAQNSPVQGSAGEYLLLAALEIEKELYPKYPDTIQTNYVHDCIIIEVPEEHAWNVYFDVIEIMERQRYGLRIPVEAFICDYWSQEDDDSFKESFKEELKIQQERRSIPTRNLEDYGWAA